MKTQSLTTRTPIGTAVWPRLNTPDTEFNQDGEFKVDLRLNPADPEVSEFLATLQRYADDAYGAICNEKGKKLKRSAFPWKNEEDRDSGNPTGQVLLRAKMKAKVTPKNGESFTQQPSLFDSQGNLMSRDVIIGGGSRLRLSVDVVPYYTAQIGAGVTVRLKAVQVVELSEYVRGGNAAAHGFEAVEGGYASTTSNDFTSDPVDESGDGAAADMEDY